MKLETIINTLGLALATATNVDQECQSAYTSDLLSDVMGFAQEGDVLITIQAHKNTVAVATLVGCPAIIICNDRPIPADMVKAAEGENISILVSKQNQFTISGRLFQLLGHS